MHCKLELDERQIPVLGLLHNLMTESLNELGFQHCGGFNHLFSDKNFYYNQDN